MHARTLIAVELALSVLVTAAGATVVHETDPAASGMASTDGTISSQAGAEEATNYTRLYIDDRYTNLRLKPGEADAVTVTVENDGDEPVELDPRLVRLDPRARPVEDAWVTIETPTTTLDPDEEVEVTINVSVTTEAELGDYRAQVAFTNETIIYPGRPPRPVHGTRLNVEVWQEPTVRIVSGSWLNTQIEAGESYIHRIVIENTGESPVPVSPELQSDHGRHRPRTNAIDRSWFEIDAPNEVQPGETATVAITISPPSDAKRGRYDAEFTLGLKDPARDDRDTYWQRVDLNFQVWKQPDEPFETMLEVSDETDDVTVTIPPRTAPHRISDTPVRFEVSFVSPDGQVIEAERISVKGRGFVDLAGIDRQRSAGSDGGVRRRNAGPAVRVPRRRARRRDMDGPHHALQHHRVRVRDRPRRIRIGRIVTRASSGDTDQLNALSLGKRVRTRFERRPRGPCINPPP